MGIRLAELAAFLIGVALLVIVAVVHEDEPAWRRALFVGFVFLWACIGTMKMLFGMP